jgi:hypothetical protein
METFRFIKILLGVFLLTLTPSLAMEDESNGDNLDSNSPPPSLVNSQFGEPGYSQTVITAALKTQLDQQLRENQKLREEYAQFLQKLPQQQATMIEEFQKTLDDAKAQVLKESGAVLDEKLRELQEGYASAIRNEPAKFTQTIRTDAYFWGIGLLGGAKILFDTYTHYTGVWSLPTVLVSTTFDNLPHIINIYFIAKIVAGARTLQGYLPSQATKKEKVE